MYRIMAILSLTALSTAAYGQERINMPKLRAIAASTEAYASNCPRCVAYRATAHLAGIAVQNRRDTNESLHIQQQNHQSSQVFEYQALYYLSLCLKKHAESDGDLAQILEPFKQ